MTYLIEDCLRIIFNELKEEPSSLYSCILVNRFWCQIGVQILWENLFDTDNDKLYNVIIHLLPTSSKQLLIDNNVILPSTDFSNKPLFNYISFSSQISEMFIYYMVYKLTKEDAFQEKFQILEQEIYKLFINNCKDISEFNWVTTHPISQYPGALTCFSQLCTLNIDLMSVTSTELFGMARICQNIEDLSIIHLNDDLTGLIMFIDTQKNLQSLYLYAKRTNDSTLGIQCEELELSKAIERKAATLKKFCMRLRETSISPKIFPSLINLEYLKICKEFGICMEEWQKYLSIASFPNLKYLKTAYLPLCVDYQLIEKSHGIILKISIYIYDRNPVYIKELLKAIARNCPKLERLTVQIGLENFIDIRDIFLKCPQLKELFLNIRDNHGDNCDEFLKILAHDSPKTLRQFSYGEEWNFSVDALQNFFENWRGRIPIKFTTRFDKCFYYKEEHIMVMKKYLDEGVIDKDTKYLLGVI